MRKVLEALMDGGAVQRFHTMPTHLKQTVGHHSFGVANLCVLLNPYTPRCVLLAALRHDLAEALVGDIPAPTKRLLKDSALGALEAEALPALLRVPPLSAEDRRLLKMADYMDGMLTCIQERRMGNQGVKHVYWNYRKYLDELRPTGSEHGLVMAITEMWAEADR